MITDEASNEVLGVLSRSWLATDQLNLLKNLLDGFLSDEAIEIKNCASVQYLLSLPKFTLIPDVLYQQGSGSLMLSNSCRLESDDRVFSDFLAHQDSVLIYAVKEAFYEYLKNSNSETKIAHNAYALNALSMKLKGEPNHFMLTLSDSFAEFIIVKEGKLIFYNQFPHDVAEDLLYYLLFVLEQNRILAPEVKLQLILQSENEFSSYKNMLSTYIGSVEELSLKHLVQRSNQYPQKELRATANMLALL